jgi:hypothetical protein
MHDLYGKKAYTVHSICYLTLLRILIRKKNKNIEHVIKTY